MLLPLRMGRTNRPDYQALRDAMLSALGDSVNTDPGTAIYIETTAYARAIYNIWILNQKMSNQFNPLKMDDLISRWEDILSIIPFQNESLSVRRKRVSDKFSIFHKIPNLTLLEDVLKEILLNTFIEVLNIDPVNSISFFPNGVNITGGEPAGNGAWYSNVSFVNILVMQPSWQVDHDYYNEIFQIYPLLNVFLPAYDTYDWFSVTQNEGQNSSFAGNATISVSAASTTLTGTNTHWKTLINTPDSVYSVMPNDEFLVKADDGLWYTLKVSTVNSDTSITLASPSPAAITNQPYHQYGFFLDEDSTAVPYPMANTKNLDNAGLY